MPKSLADIYNRALERIVSEGKESITQAILPWITAAKQPLSLSQLEECCLIRVLQEYSIKDRYVNGIHLVDTWFQGLVEVDHETKTVHFVHSSVRKFFLTAMANSALEGFHVNMAEADRHIGEVIVTYLNFNDFKTTIAHRLPALPPISPKDICGQAISNEFGWRKFLLRGRGARTADIDGTIVTCTQHSRATFQERMEMEHPFLLYASAHWLLHSLNFDQNNCRVWHVWKGMLIKGHDLAAPDVSEKHRQTIYEAFTHWDMSTGHSSLLYIAATSRYLLARFHIAMFDYVIDNNNPELLSLMVKTEDWGDEIDPLCCRAARQGFVEVVKILLEAGVEINGEHITPSSHVTSESDSDTSVGALTSYPPEHRRPLIAAIEAGQVETVELLLDLGADPNLSTHHYRNALEPAVRLGGSEGIRICQVLLKAGVDVVDTHPSGITVLQIACETGQEEIVKLLLGAGAHPNYYGRTVDGSPLLLAIRNEHIQIIRLLLKFDANVNIEDGEGLTPLERACSLKGPRLDIVETLIKAGANTDKLQICELLNTAVKGRRVELVKLLIKGGANVNEHPDGDDRTPLALAADQGQFKIMHVLLDAGALVVDTRSLLSRVPSIIRNGEEYEDILWRLHRSTKDPYFKQG